MPVPVQPLPTIGQPNASEDPKTRSALSELQTILTAGVDETNLVVALLQKLGLNSGSQVGRGKSIIATSESRTNVAYGTLTTPDRVTGIVLPTDGLIAVAYQATWQESVLNAARAAIFIGATQMSKIFAENASPTLPDTPLSGTVGAAVDRPLATFSGGLASLTNGGGAYTGDVTTGQAIGSFQGAGVIFNNGGPVYIFAAAGTYDVSIQFKSSSGSVTAKNRKLWCWSIGF